MDRNSLVRRLVRRAPSPAMVVACLALAIALSGVGYAAVVLPRNSVGTAQLKRDAVISSKVKNGSLRAVDLGASQFAGEAWREIEPADTAGGEPDFLYGWTNLGGNPYSGSGVFSSAAFYRDRAGIVHLKGVVVPGTYVIFVLPAGYRPALNSIFAAASDDSTGAHSPGHIYIRSSNGYVEAFAHGTGWVSLDAISFRCAPSGQFGCP